MQNSSILFEIAEVAHRDFETRTKARDIALTQARTLTRHAAHAIRAVHRGEQELALAHIAEGQLLFTALRQDLAEFPDLYYAGYTQDAIKEFCEATLTCAIINHEKIPTPAEMGVSFATYLRGLAETPGELRRKVLDILRSGYTPEVERLLAIMDDVYSIMITMDYPDAVTNGLRRQTDLLRGIVERTRADLTLSLREEKLKNLLQKTVDSFSNYNLE